MACRRAGSGCRTGRGLSSCWRRPACRTGEWMREPWVAQSAAGTAPGPTFGVYIHWPFCRSKCPYCDFNSHVRDSVDADRWADALLKDLEYQASLAPDREVVSIFFGGGPPSLMPPDTTAALIERVKTLYPTAADLEITL